MATDLDGEYLGDKLNVQIEGVNVTKENQDALKDGKLGLPGTHSPGQIIVSELHVLPLGGLRYTYAAWNRRSSLTIVQYNDQGLGFVFILNSTEKKEK